MVSNRGVSKIILLLLLAGVVFAVACSSGKTHGSKGNNARKRHYPYKARD
jgi:hypothetical protein